MEPTTLYDDGKTVIIKIRPNQYLYVQDGTMPVIAVAYRTDDVSNLQIGYFDWPSHFQGTKPDHVTTRVGILLATEPVLGHRYLSVRTDPYEVEECDMYIVGPDDVEVRGMYLGPCQYFGISCVLNASDIERADEALNAVQSYLLAPTLFAEVQRKCNSA